MKMTRSTRSKCVFLRRTPDIKRIGKCEMTLIVTVNHLTVCSCWTPIGSLKGGLLDGLRSSFPTESGCNPDR